MKTVPDVGGSQQAGRSGNAAFLSLRWRSLRRCSVARFGFFFRGALL